MYRYCNRYCAHLKQIYRSIYTIFFYYAIIIGGAIENEIIIIRAN